VRKGTVPHDPDAMPLAIWEDLVLHPAVEEMVAELDDIKGPDFPDNTPSSTVKFDTPMKRTLPARTRSSMAPKASSRGVLSVASGSGRHR